MLWQLQMTSQQSQSQPCTTLKNWELCGSESLCHIKALSLKRIVFQLHSLHTPFSAHGSSRLKPSRFSLNKARLERQEEDARLPLFAMVLRVWCEMQLHPCMSQTTEEQQQHLYALPARLPAELRPNSTALGGEEGPLRGGGPTPGGKGRC